MTTLLDNLLVKVQLYAVQFCYIVSVAECDTDSNKCAKVRRELSGHCKTLYCFSLQLVLLIFSVADETPLLGSQQVTLLHPGPLPAGVQVGCLPGGQP